MILLFGGQGSQKPGMGKDLLAYPEARKIYEIAWELQPDTVSLFSHTAEELAATRNAQPAIALHQMALVNILAARGLRPTAVVGLSIGEFAALYAAGYLDAEACVRVVLERARLMSNVLQGRTGDGMLAVLGPQRSEVEAVLTKHPQVSLANINSATQHVLSGTLSALRRIESDFTGARLIYLQVEGAFHSPIFDPCIEAFRKVLAGVSWHEPQCFMPLNRSGKAAKDIVREMAEQLARPLEVDACLEALAEHCNDEELFVELAAQPVLMPLMKRKHRRGDFIRIGTAADFAAFMEA